MKKLLSKLIPVLVVLVTASCSVQKAKVQSAWRSLSDYEASVAEGRPNPAFLQKAKQAVDEAMLSSENRAKTRAQAYKFRIYYALYRQNLDQEIRKTDSTKADKNERLMIAYGNTRLDEFEEAEEALDTIREIDPAYFEKISEGIKNQNAGLEEDDLKLALAVKQMKLESGNIATGKYKAKKYDQAADYFYKTAVMNSILYKTKDTANFYNACVSASRSKDPAKIKTYNMAMIDAGLASPYNYESLYNSHILVGDSAEAIEALHRGRMMFPGDATLLTLETNIFLATDRHEDALNNLRMSADREPENVLFFFVMGNIYDNMANPKDKQTGKELQKPELFEAYFSNAEQNYLRAIELNPSNQEYLYNSLYNLGAMYNNYGGYIAGTEAKNTKHQKEIDAKAQEFYKKAIPYLERALELRSGDKSTMVALRKLYLLTKNTQKAKEMSERLKAVE